MTDSVDSHGDGAGTATVAPTAVYIGLGPAASTISEATLRERLEEVTPVLGLRFRGRSAFADVSDAAAAQKLIAALNGQSLQDIRMEVQLSRGKERRPAGRTTALFVGLGPNGGAVSSEELRARLEEVAPVMGFRRRGQCTFVDVADPARAEQVIQALNNQYIGDCRLSVQLSREKNGKAPRGQKTDGRRRDRSRSGERGRHGRRGRSRDRRRRRHRSRSSSYSSRSTRSSSYDSRDRRRRRRERSPSYSSASRSSSGSYRRRRD